MQFSEVKNIQYLKIDGKVNYHRILIFLPGLGAFKENYIDFSEQVSSCYDAIYILDLPQQGSKGEWTIGTMVSNLVSFINHIDNKLVKEIHLAGHSIGAVAILSFIFNLNKDVEDAILSNSNGTQGENELQLIINKGFTKELEESKKVTKLFLYSPCDSFENVFPKYFVKKLENSREGSVKTILDLCINKPMTLLKPISHKKHVDFHLNHKRKPQYFGLIIEDYKSFFNYIYNGLCIFELVTMFNDELKSLIDELFENKKVVIQYGSLDWLLISRNRSKRKMLSNLKVCDDASVIEHKYLGHFLYKKHSLDINLNNQMLINSNVINQSLKFMTK